MGYTSAAWYVVFVLKTVPQTGHVHWENNHKQWALGMVAYVQTNPNGDFDLISVPFRTQRKQVRPGTMVRSKLFAFEDLVAA